MPTQKKQHYVPQCLLKNFANNDKNFYIFDLLKNNIVAKPIPYKTQCYTNYLYGKDGKWEKAIAKIETATAPIIQKLIENKSITFDEELTIKKFILFQYCRTERSIDLTNYMVADMYSKIIPVLLRQEGLSVPENLKKLCIDNILKENNRSETAVQHIEFAEESKESLNDLKLTVLCSSSYEFALSDNPVIIHNKYDTIGGQGLQCAGIIFIMPISAQKCILLYDDGIYDLLKYGDQVILTDNEVKRINMLLYLHSRQAMYSLNLKTISDIKKYYDSRYLDNFLRDIYAKIGFTDFIMINIAIANLKKHQPLLLQQLSPKYYAQKEGEYLPFLAIKNQFIPYTTDLNAGFNRFTDMENIPAKYYGIKGNYVMIIQSYLKDKKDKQK